MNRTGTRKHEEVRDLHYLWGCYLEYLPEGGFLCDVNPGSLQNF